MSLDSRVLSFPEPLKSSNLLRLVSYIFLAVEHWEELSPFFLLIGLFHVCSAGSQEVGVAFVLLFFFCDETFCSLLIFVYFF